MKSRIHYYTKQFSDILYDPQKTWRTLKNLLLKSQTVVPYAATISGQTLSGRALADEFNRHFLLSGAPSLQSTASFQTYVACNLSNCLFLRPTSRDEIVMLMKSIKTNSVEFDYISAKPIKAVCDPIADVRCFITNLVLSTGIFPDKMKIAKVCVLHKGGPIDCLGNYRPISILPLFVKVVKNVINERITKHLNKYELLSPHQYGFQKGKTTKLALLKIRDKIT